LPDLEGKLTRLSADALTEERTGLTYYSAQITVSRAQLDTIRSVRGGQFELRAGMPVEVLIPLRERTALEYALEPLVGAFWASFREQ
jgi:HlyD family secretion protein